MRLLLVTRHAAEHLIRSLADIRGGRSLVEALLHGLQNLPSANPEESGSIQNLPPTTQAGYRSDQSIPQPATRAGDLPRDLPRDLPPGSLDNMHEGGRYNDKELADHTKALVTTPPIKLPKLHAKADYQPWRSEVPLQFDMRMLGDITYGAERYDDAQDQRRPKYHEWFKARKNKAFSALALSLSVDLRTTFKIDKIRDDLNAAALLFDRITQHFEASDGINPDYLLQELVTRRLKSSETVAAYAEDIARKVTALHHANGEFTEWQHASLLLSNCVEVYQGLAREHGD